MVRTPPFPFDHPVGLLFHAIDVHRRKVNANQAESTATTSVGGLSAANSRASPFVTCPPTIIPT